MKIAEIVELLVEGDAPVRFEAYDGSSFGPADAPFVMRLTNERGLRYIATAPGELGLARAYVSGDLRFDGAHPGDPYDVLVALSTWRIRRPTPAEIAPILRSVSWRSLVPPPPPEQEVLPRWRRAAEGLRHSRQRDAASIHHHYDVSNAFYEMVLGPTMAYTCAVFPKTEATLDEAQEGKFDLVARKLELAPGMRLLDIGCGWGGMVIHAAKHYGVTAVGITLSAEQTAWGRDAVEREGLSGQVEILHGDYRDSPGTEYDAISSIGVLEHVGLHNYPAYFGFVRDRLRVGGRLLNHCITRPRNDLRARPGAFIDRYVFPDGELTGSGRIITEAQDSGLEVRHEENLREHYGLTLTGWCANLRRNWDACVREVGDATARVWGLYMAASRLAFERRQIELHQVLASRTSPDGVSGFDLRPTWQS